MFKDAYKKLEDPDKSALLGRLNTASDLSDFTGAQTTLLAHPLPFYPGYMLAEATDHSLNPPKQQVFLYNEKNLVLLDWSNKPIYALNKTAPLILNEVTVCTYVRFFFTYVKGQYGRFLIVENVDDIHWTEEPSPAARKAMMKMLAPLEVLQTDADGTFHLLARIIFKDSLFQSNVSVKPDGLVTLSNEELLVEDIPVMEDTLGQ